MFPTILLDWPLVCTFHFLASTKISWFSNLWYSLGICICDFSGCWHQHRAISNDSRKTFSGSYLEGLKPILVGKAWQQEHGASGQNLSAVGKQSEADAQVLMFSSSSYLPFMIRSRPQPTARCRPCSGLVFTSWKCLHRHMTNYASLVAIQLSWK